MKLNSYVIVLFMLGASNALIAQSNLTVVINELMSDNEAAVADEAGDFDDWIELYNNMDTPMDLSGFGLSDDENDLGKFTIPEGTVIAENGYLIFWADDDQEQGPLHVQFKLSAVGESLFLTDPNNNIVDQVDFPELDEDFSFARDPNGIGSFVIKQPTFNNDNDLATSTLTPLPKNISFYPNPTSDFLKIDLGDLEIGSQVLIYNQQGQVINKLIASSSILEIDMKTFANGSYIIQLEGYEGVLINKIK